MAEPSASSSAAAAAAAAAAATIPTDAEREDALDRMLTRLALAEDARLAPLLARVLPYAITSLASPAPPVRKLVASMVVLKDLEALLLENSQVEQIEVRFSAVRWATTLYDMQHCPSRYICMLGASYVKLDIREMALTSLNLLNDERQSSATAIDFNYPGVVEMLNYIYSQQPQLLHSNDQRHGKPLFPSKTFLAMIKFLMKCFEASDSPDLLQEDPSHSPVAKMCVILEHAMSYEGSSELHALALKSLVNISSRQPKLVSSRYANRLHWLRALLSHVDSDAREAAARLLGIAASAISSSAALNLLSELTSTLDQNHPSSASNSFGYLIDCARFEIYHGLLCAIGYITACCLKESYIPEELVKNVVDVLVKVVESEGSTLASIAMESLGHIGLHCALPSISRNSSTAAVLTVLHERLTKLLSENDTKAVQKILVSLGHISWNELSFSHLKIALDLIFSLSRSKVEDVLIASREALSFIWCEVPVTADVILETNFVSLSQATNFLCEEARTMAREEIIKLFDTLIYSSRKEERCAGTVCLVSQTMYCRRLPKILELLPQIQMEKGAKRITCGPRKNHDESPPKPPAKKMRTQLQTGATVTGTPQGFDLAAQASTAATAAPPTPLINEMEGILQKLYIEQSSSVVTIASEDKTCAEFGTGFVLLSEPNYCLIFTSSHLLIGADSDTTCWVYFENEIKKMARRLYYAPKEIFMILIVLLQDGEKHSPIKFSKVPARHESVVTIGALASTKLHLLTEVIDELTSSLGMYKGVVDTPSCAACDDSGQFEAGSNGLFMLSCSFQDDIIPINDIDNEVHPAGLILSAPIFRLNGEVIGVIYSIDCCSDIKVGLHTTEIISLIYKMCSANDTDTTWEECLKMKAENFLSTRAASSSRPRRAASSSRPRRAASSSRPRRAASSSRPR